MRRLALMMLAVAMVAAACGDGDVAPATTAGAVASSTATQDGGFPVTLSTGAGEVTIPAAPRRIAALSATHVEMLFALGAGDQVIAGDKFSTYPEEAAELEKLDSFNLSAEAVIALDPDLVVLAFDPVSAVPALAAVEIPTLLLPTAVSLEDAYAQLELLGRASGHPADAIAVVDGMRDAIAATVARVGDRGQGVSFYHETDPFSFYTPNSQSFLGQLYVLLGMDNIADAAPDELSSGFPQLSPEFIIASDPDLVYLGAEGEDAATLAVRDGWDSMRAVAEGRIVVLDADVASRWGPRVPQLFDAIADGLLEHAP